jgi:Zn-finger nucleic acid-binding protein
MTVPFDCPRCGTVLTMSERAGVEIDYCPQCRGVWLDRGELDKIVERAEATSPQPSAAPSSWSAPAARGWAPGATHGSRPYAGGHDGGHGRRKSWLREIFD